MDINNEENLKESFKKFLRTVFEVIDLQAKEAGQEKTKIPIILGADSRESYNLENIAKAVLGAFREVLEEQGKTIDELLSKVNFHLNLYGKAMYDFETLESHMQTEAERNNPSPEVLALLHVEAQPDNLHANEWLARNEAAIKAGDEDSLKAAKEYAYQEGKRRAVQLSQIDSWSKNFRFVHTHTKHPVLNKIPRLNYLAWHKDLKPAYRQGYSEASGTEHQVVLKAIQEDRKEPFVDILACYIQDLFQNLGDLSPYADIMKDQIVPLFRGKLK